MNSEQAAALLQAAQVRLLQQHKENSDRQKELRQRYRFMRKQIDAWEPSAEHEGLKDFMLQQIGESTYFLECQRPPMELPSAEEWLANERKVTTEGIEYHAEREKLQIDRNQTRAAWIRALASLVPPPSQP
jgi:hypothetical protein